MDPGRLCGFPELYQVELLNCSVDQYTELDQYNNCEAEYIDLKWNSLKWSIRRGGQCWQLFFCPMIARFGQKRVSSRGTWSVSLVVSLGGLCWLPTRSHFLERGRDCKMKHILAGYDNQVYIIRHNLGFVTPGFCVHSNNTCWLLAFWIRLYSHIDLIKANLVKCLLVIKM